MDIEEAHHLPNYDAMEDHLQTEDVMQMKQSFRWAIERFLNLMPLKVSSHKEIAEQLKLMKTRPNRS